MNTEADSSNTPKGDKWDSIGKPILIFAGFLGGFWTLLQIWNTIKPGPIALKAVATISRAEAPPDLLADIQFLNNHYSYRSLNQILSKGLDQSLDKLSPSERDLMILKVSEAIEKSIPSDFKYRSYRYSGYCDVEISNSGTMPAEDVVLTFPRKGLIKIVYSNQEQKIDADKNTAQIGTVLPNTMAKVQFWSAVPILAADQEQMVISHHSGTGEIQYSSTIFGFWAWMDRHSTLFTPLIFMGIWLLFLYIVWFFKPFDTFLRKRAVQQLPNGKD